MVPPFNLVSNVKSIIKLLSILAILVASMFSVSSCTEDWEDAYLAIDQNNFSIPSSGETKTISIQTNSDWRVVTKNASWVTFDKTSGTGNSELQISVGRNRSNKRTAIVTVCAGTESAEIEQAASTTGTLSVTTGACTIKREKSGSKYKYTITAGYNVQGGHLASEVGIMFGNSPSKTTGTITDGLHKATAYVTTSNSNYTVTYRAYAVKKSNGAKVYGTTKTKRYK